MTDYLLLFLICMHSYFSNTLAQLPFASRTFPKAHADYEDQANDVSVCITNNGFRLTGYLMGYIPNGRYLHRMRLISRDD